MTLFSFSFFFFFLECVCIEIKEDIENMKLMHVIYDEKKSNKRKNFYLHLILQLERLVKRNKTKLKFNRIEKKTFSFLLLILLSSPKHPFVFFNQHSSAPCSLYKERPPAR
jgi:hypothetical protein